eukprot:Skav207277  [mRNA]  locus=scaffold434:138177:138833:+ [translate_table: standard]
MKLFSQSSLLSWLQPSLTSVFLRNVGQRASSQHSLFVEATMLLAFGMLMLPAEHEYKEQVFLQQTSAVWPTVLLASGFGA